MGKKDEVDEYQDKIDEALMNEDYALFRHLIGEDDKEDEGDEKGKK